MIDELELDVEHAEAIVAAGIEFEVYTEDMPDSDADKIEAAHDIVAMAIDSWVDDEVRPDNDDEQIASAGEQIKQILDTAGIEIDENDEVTYGELPEFEDDDDGEGVDLAELDRKQMIAYAKENDFGLKPRGKSDDEIREFIAEKMGVTSDDDDEAPFAIDDVIEGYDDMNVKDIVEALADLEDEEIEQVKEYEKTEGRKRKQILNFEPDDGEPDGDEDGDEVDLAELSRKELVALNKEHKLGITTRGLDDDALRAAIAEQMGATSDDEDGDDDEGESGEPWDGYEGATVKDIKEGLEAAKDDEDPLTVEQVDYVIQYEEAREKPRPSLVKWLKALAAELGAPDSDDDAGEDVDNAVAKDDRKDARKAKAGTIVVTRDQILEALAKGKVTIDLS